MVVPRQGRRERSYLEDTGATEGAASGRAARSGGSAGISSSPPSRALLVGSLGATLVAWSWLRLEQRTGLAQVVLVVALALVPAIVPGARRRAVAALIAAGSFLELAFGWSFPGGILSSFGRGFLDFYDVQVPFDPATHARMHGVLLVAVFAFTLWIGLAAAARRPGLASAGLVVGVGWPGTLLPGHDLLRGALLLAGVLIAIVFLRRGPLRGLGTALAAGALVLVAAVGASSSPAFAKHEFLHWQRWDLHSQQSKPVDVSYVWDSSYDGLTFRGKPTTVLRIKAGPTPQYWRATVLNAVSGGRWIQDPILQTFPTDPLGEAGLVPERQTERTLWVKERVKVEALSDRHLVGGSIPVLFEPGAGMGLVEYDLTGIAQSRDPVPRGSTYDVSSYSPSPTPAQLARSKPIYSGPIASADRKYREVEQRVFPDLFGTPNRKRDLEFLFTKSNYAPKLRPYRPLYVLAEQVAGGAKSPYAAAVALERWFRIGGGFIYDQHPPKAIGVPPLVDFVARTHRGYCQHFAGAMALMLRYLGIPSRVAAGFTSGRYDKGSGEWVVSDRDAHTWVEVWFRGWGWLPFDPTPSRSGLAGQYSSSSPSFDVAAATKVLAGSQGIRKFGSGLADKLGFGGGPRLSPDVPVLGAAPPGASSPDRSRAWGLLRLLAAALGGLALVVIAAKLVLRRSRYLTRDPRRLAAACRKELRDVLLDQHVEVPPSATLRELAELVREEFGVEAAAFGLHADAARFGPANGAREAARATRRDLRRLRRGLRRELTRFERVRGLLSLRSLGLAG
jgi:transglutaminase-like putative cysteine protease